MLRWFRWLLADGNLQSARPNDNGHGVGARDYAESPTSHHAKRSGESIASGYSPRACRAGGKQ